jgi:3-deoxy-D-manno-octulosonate 8-phosphate phosphatase (KDO 8-P phosphatase)
MKLKKIQLIVLDADGTLTDGNIYIDDNHIEIKKFNVKDGLGISLAQTAGINFFVLTGRTSKCLEYRMQELKIQYFQQGIKDKYKHLKYFAEKNGLMPENIAYMGDDLNDLPVMRYVGVSACPKDAVEDVKKMCDYVLSKNGGEGAVREFVEIVLKEQNLFEKAKELFLNNKNYH